MIRFEINDQLDERTYEVRVYPDRHAYLAACRRHRADEEHHNSHATTFHERVIVLEPDGREWERPCIGRIYMHEEMLDGEIVTHESIHAALNLYRRRHRGVASFGRNYTDAEIAKEEELALSAGRLGQMIADKMWETKVWKRPSAKKVA